MQRQKTEYPLNVLERLEKARTINMLPKIKKRSAITVNVRPQVLVLCSAFFKSFEALTSVNIHKQNSITEQHKEQDLHTLLVKPSATQAPVKRRCLPSVAALPAISACWMSEVTAEG